VNRRSLLTSVALALATRRLPLPSYTGLARADEKSWRHGLALFGDFKYPAGFKQFDYVNVSAPKGGTVRQIALGTYDNFNIVVDGVKGALVLGVDLNYDTLLVPALDEVASEYGLLAEAVSYPDDFSSASFRLRATAKWHDGTPVTPEDVIFSFETFRKLSPQAGANYQHVAKAEKVGNREVTFTFDGPGNRSLPQVLGQLTVLQRAWWEGTDTDGKRRDSVRQRWSRHLAPVRTALRNSPPASLRSLRPSRWQLKDHRVTSDKSAPGLLAQHRSKSAFVRMLRVNNTEAHGSGAGPVEGCKMRRMRIRFFVNQVVNIPLTIDGDRLAAMPRHFGKTHKPEQPMQLQRFGMGRTFPAKCPGKAVQRIAGASSQSGRPKRPPVARANPDPVSGLDRPPQARFNLYPPPT
jgi:hypothetical protein